MDQKFRLALTPIVLGGASTATPAPDTPPAPEAILPASLASVVMVTPRPRPAALVAAAPPAKSEDAPDEQIIVTRMSTSGGRHWAINVGRFTTRHEAEKMLLQTALVELGTLDEALRKVTRSSRGFEANFVGLSEPMAKRACSRLSAKNQSCVVIDPLRGCRSRRPRLETIPERTAHGLS